MPTKIAINGFGRIGRSAFKRILEKYPDLDLVAINDLTDNKTLSHLLKYDSVYGVYQKDVDYSEKGIIVDNKEFKVFSEKNPENLPWKELNVDIVLECTGYFRDLEGAQKHIKAGAEKVIISAPSKSEEIPMFVLGVNENKYNSQDIVSMASCTTNCIAPVTKILQENFGIIKGFMTTIHSYTNDQRILDLPHEDLRRARAAALNIIPTSTGATKALSRVIPELKDKLDGIAIRVPTPTVSIVDLVVESEKKTTVNEVNNIFEKSTKDHNFSGILEATKKELVSSDFIGNTNSSIIDLSLTMVKENMIKIIAWYDNEYGYACRLADFATYISNKK